MRPVTIGYHSVSKEEWRGKEIASQDYYLGPICITAHARVLINSWVLTNQQTELRFKPMITLQSYWKVTGIEIQDGWPHSTTAHAKGIYNFSSIMTW